jgi:hypothetical protein
MTTATQPISTSIGSWANRTFILPYAEGAARVNRAFLGIDLREIDSPKINLTNRCIDILTGLVLFIPILNSILMVFFRTFGNMEILTQKSNLPSVKWQEALCSANSEKLPSIKIDHHFSQPTEAIQKDYCFKNLIYPSNLTFYQEIYEKNFTYINTKTVDTDLGEVLNQSSSKLNKNLEIEKFSAINYKRNISAEIYQTKGVVSGTQTKLDAQNDDDENSSIEWVIPENTPFVASWINFLPYLEKESFQFVSVNPENLSSPASFRAKVEKTILNDNEIEYRLNVDISKFFWISFGHFTIKKIGTEYLFMDVEANIGGIYLITKCSRSVNPEENPLP